MTRMILTLVAALGLVVTPMALAAPSVVPQVPAGPAVIEVPVPGTHLTSAALVGGPDELTVGAARCAQGTCRIPLAMGATGGLDLRRADPHRVATLNVQTDRGSRAVVLRAAPSLAAQITHAADLLGFIQRWIGMAMIIGLSVASVFFIELDPHRTPGRIARRVSVASWAVGLLPVASATAVVIAMGGGSRGFMLCALITAWGIPLLRMLVVVIATRPAAQMAQ